MFAVGRQNTAGRRAGRLWRGRRFRACLRNLSQALGTLILGRGSLHVPLARGPRAGPWHDWKTGVGQCGCLAALGTWAVLALTVTVGIVIGRYSAASSTTTPAAQALVMRDELREALNHDQLVLHYQPTMELGTGRVSALESLVRWQHPSGGC